MDNIFVFMYCLNPDSTEPIMIIDQMIGDCRQEGDFGSFLSGSDFARELIYMDQQGKKRIQVWINSQGGVVMDALSIINAILRTSTPVDTYCTGMACSSAALVFLAGKNRYIMDYAKLMFHGVSGGDNADPVALQAYNDTVSSIITRAGIDKDTADQMLMRDTWISSTEAKAMNLATEVESSKSFNKKRLSTTDTTAFYKEASIIMNQLIINKTQKMNPIAKALGLADDATEQEIVAAINAAKSTPAPIVNVAETPEFVALKSQLDEITNTTKANELAAKKSAAIILVNSEVKRLNLTVTDDEKQSFVNQATENFAATEALFKAMPVNKPNPGANQGNEGKVTAKYTAGEIMNSIAMNHNQYGPKQEVYA